ncbi:transmembrane protein 245-like isoform X2 [Symsagittifera roscoffensis]|uniref:transmembrane protein 245-like isoform X2 n=1 Tax=Symsagittifera roscoffensis TaxID=84072 RepID=UPI00307BE657
MDSRNTPNTGKPPAGKSRPNLARFNSLSFIHDYKLASEMFAGNEKLFKQAFFNAAANIFVLLAILASIAVFFVLEVFLRPLLWATLTGSFLYPFKKAATGAVQRWLKSLTQSGTPLFIGLLLLPFNFVNYLSDLIGIFISKKFYLFVIAFLSYPLLYLVFAWTPVRLFCKMIAWFINSMLRLHGGIASFWCRFVAPYFWTIYVAYFILAFFYSTQDNTAVLKRISVVVWALLVYHLLITSSSVVVLGLLMLTVIAVAGYIQNSLKDPQRKKSMVKFERQSVPVPLVSLNESSQEVPDYKPEDEGDGGGGGGGATNAAGADCGHEQRVTESVESVNEVSDQQSVNSNESLQDISNTMTDYVQKSVTWLRMYSQQVFEHTDPASTHASTDGATSKDLNTNGHGDMNDLIVSFGFYSLFWSILMIQTLKHLWILPVLFIPITLFVIKRSFFLFKLDHLLKPYFSTAKDKVMENQHILMPSFLKQMIHFYLLGDKKVIKVLKGSIGVVVTVLLVSLLLVGSIVLSFLLAAQIQEEGMAIVEIGTTLAHEASSMYPEFRTVLPNSTDIQSSLTMVVERAYGYSRGLIENWITSYLVPGGESDEKSEEITNQLLKIYDELYLQLWVNRNQTSNQSIAEVFSSVKSLYEETAEGGMDSSLVNGEGFLKAFKSHGSDLFYSVYDVIHGNFDTLRSISLSVWSILHSNINIVFSVLTSLIWVILSSGSHIMNFLISFVVFLTALFYLLSLSGSRYKPMEFVASIMPADPAAVGMGNGNNTSGGSKSMSSSVASSNTFAEAVNSAVMGVFGASLKLSSFYGLLTYVTHSVAGVRLVFLPAAVAALLGAVPVFGTYLAAIPAVLELWLLHDEWIGALVLMIFHMLPTYGGFDAAIYAQISGAGHPYLTGLAVVGGISVRGLEGAILGPILLCVLIVVSNVYSSVIAGNTSENNANNASSSVESPYAESMSVSNERRATKHAGKSLRSHSFMGMDANVNDLSSQDME